MNHAMLLLKTRADIFEDLEFRIPRDLTTLSNSSHTDHLIDMQASYRLYINNPKAEKIWSKSSFI